MTRRLGNVKTRRKTTVIAVWWNQRDALFIKFIENQGHLHVSSITCLTSGGATQMAFGILRAYNVSWLWHCCSNCNSATANWHYTHAIYQMPFDADELVMLETCRGPLILKKFKEKWITLVSLCWYTMIHGQQNIKFTTVIVLTVFPVEAIINVERELWRMRVFCRFNCKVK
jgi:hypothetical protein